MKSIFYSKHSETAVLISTDIAFCPYCFSTRTFIFAALVCVLANIVAAQNNATVNLSDLNVRRHAVERLETESRQKKASAWAIAESQGWPGLYGQSDECL